MIEILFGGDPNVQDPTCPSPRADFDYDGFSTALDLSDLIDHLFSGGAGPIDPPGERTPGGGAMARHLSGGYPNAAGQPG